jgi:uncharacterized protein (TIGR02300 family)
MRFTFPNNLIEAPVAKPELGTKRVDPVTGRKFYDLNKDPIISPYTGQSYPRTMFDPQPKAARPSNDDEEETEVEAKNAPEFVPLAEADAGETAKDIPVDDIEIEDDGAEEDDTFLEEEEEEDGNVSDLIDSEIEDDEEA